MKVILIMMGGVLAVFAFVFYVKNYLLTPERLLFHTVEVKGKNHTQVVKTLVRELNKAGLKVIKVLPMSRVLKARGVKDFPSYTTILACDIPLKKQILLSIPFMSVLIPCSIAVYEQGGKIHITAMRDYLILRDFAEELPDAHAQEIMNTYGKLRAVIERVAQK